MLAACWTNQAYLLSHLSFVPLLVPSLLRFRQGNARAAFFGLSRELFILPSLSKNFGMKARTAQPSAFLLEGAFVELLPFPLYPCEPLISSFGLCGPPLLVRAILSFPPCRFVCDAATLRSRHDGGSLSVVRLAGATCHRRARPLHISACDSSATALMSRGTGSSFP